LDFATLIIYERLFSRVIQGCQILAGADVLAGAGQQVQRHNLALVAKKITRVTRVLDRREEMLIGIEWWQEHII